MDLPYLEQVPTGTMQERLATVTRAVIEEAAERGNAVIIGRGAAWILGKRPDVLNVQLHASMEARVRYLWRASRRSRRTRGRRRSHCASCASPLTRRAASTSGVCMAWIGWTLAATTSPWMWAGSASTRPRT